MNRSSEALIILGIDPGLSTTGWGVISVSGLRISHVAHGTISPATSLPLAQRLLVLSHEIDAVVEKYRPSEAAIEETFVNSNGSSTLKLGHARGVLMVGPAKAGIPIAEYAARVVKKCIVGTGGAQKEQVSFMIRRLLPSADVREADAADALAVAITHAHNRSGVRLRQEG